MISPQTLLQNRYLVLEQIGQGGMGAVYRATDQRFGSTVALKETFFEDPALRRAFEREARLLNHLRHHALPRVSDYFSEGEGLFLVMEFIPGEDLAQMLKARGEAFPASEVLSWADQLLDALDYLHTQETPVVHRDIKPQNLKLTGRSQIVLLDFGLAKGPAFQATRATTTGSVLGYSLNYAPLEQMQGVGTDPRSDLYSLGATLYHLLTGVTPSDAISRATAVLNGQPDPLLPANEVNPQVSAGAAAVLSSALAQNAGQRPQSAEAMRASLREAATRGADAAATVTSGLTPAASLNEQDTQLLTRRDRPQPDTVAGGDAGGASAAAPEASEARTGQAQPASVVTRVRPAGVTTPGVRSAGRGRALGLAGVGLALVLAAVAVYSFTSGWHAGISDAQPTPQPTPQAASEPTPAPASVAAEPPQSTPTPVVAIVSKSQTGKADKKVKRADRAKVAAGAETSENDNAAAEVPEVEADDAVVPSPRARPLTPEELEAVRARRIAEETRKRIRQMQRQQQLEEMRRRGRGFPPPRRIPPPPP